MARKDQIELEMSVLTQEAESSIKGLNSSLKETTKLIDSLRSSKGADLSGGDIDRVLNEIQKDLRKSGTARGSMMADVRNPNARTSEDKKPAAKDLAKSVVSMDTETNKVLESFARRIDDLKSLSQSQSRMGKSRSQVPGGPTNPQKIFPEESELSIRETQRDKQKVGSRVTSTVTGLDRAAQSGSLTHNQAGVLRGQMEGAYYGSTGASSQDKGAVESYARGEGEITWDTEGSPLGRARDKIGDSGDRIQELQGEHAGLVTQTSEGREAYTEEAWSELIMSQNKVAEEIQSQQKIRQDNKALLTEIVDGINRVKSATDEFNEETKDSGVRVAADPESMEGILASRSNAIAIAGVSSAMYTLNKSLQEGKAIVESERPSSLEIGMSSGNYDFREIRGDAREDGKEQGYLGKEMLEFTKSVMGTMGFDDETKGVTDELARGERLSGTSEGTYSTLFETALRSGAVSNEEEARDFTDQITGGIANAGLTGQSQEQTTAIQALLDETVSGRSATNDEIKSQLAMISVLSGTGEEAFQGENLQQNVSSLQQGIANDPLYSEMSMRMGYGTDPNISALDVQEEKEKGLGSEIMMDLVSEAIQDRGGGMASEDYVATEAMFAGLSAQGQRTIMELGMADELNAESAQEVEAADIAAGKDTMGDREEGFQESSDKDRLSTDLLKQILNVAPDESIIGDLLTKISNSLLGIATATVGGAIAANIIGGVTKSIGGMVMKSIGMGGLSEGFKKLTGGLFGDPGSQLAGGPIAEGGLFKNLFGGGLLTGAKDMVMGGAGKVKDLATGGFGAAKTALSGGKEGIGALLSGITTEGASKAVKGGAYTKLAYDTISGGYKVSQADNKKAEAASQAGNAAGGFGGAMGGAAAGAAIGSVVPIIGTAIGSLIGGGLGAIGGSKVGKGIGDWGAEKWLGGTDEQNKQKALEEGIITEDMSEEEQQAALADTQEELANTSEKGDIEGRRLDNIHAETENLSTWDNLVKDIRELLAIAKAQNGIVGNKDGLGGGPNSSGTGVSGELGTVDEGDYWTSSNIKQHDISKTSSELTSGQLDEWIADKAPKNSAMLGMGSAFMDAGNKHGVDPRMLVGLAGHESGWGTSKQAKEKNNFFGMNANTNSPGDAFGYGDGTEGIMDAARRISSFYIAEGKDTLEKMNPKYAEDPDWAQGIADTMKGSEKYTDKSKGDVTINTETTVNYTPFEGPKKDTKKEARTIGQMITDFASRNISKTYTQETKRN